MTATLERNLVLGLCTLFAVSALAFAAVDPSGWAALAGWAVALVQTLRLHVLRTDPDRRPRGQVTDVLMTALLTILIASVLYATYVYYRARGTLPLAAPPGAAESSLGAFQFAAYGAIVGLGGWVVAWMQSLRRLRLNLRYTAESGIE